MKRSLFAAACLLAFSVPGFGAFTKSDAGTAGASFLKLGAGGRATAMGNAFTAVADDATAVYWNPAGLNRVTARSASVMHAVWFEDIFYDWVSYVHPVEKIGVFGLGVQYLSFGSIPRTGVSGESLGDYSPNDTAVTLSYARTVAPFSVRKVQLPRILLGGSVKYVSSKIRSDANAYALDAGAMSSFLKDRLTVGIDVQNIGTPLRYSGSEDQLPAVIRLGGAYRVRDNLLASFDVSAPFDNELYYGLGAEYAHTVNPALAVFGRAGYSTQANAAGGLSGASFGVGLRFLSYRFDYAFVPFGDLGDTHRISFGVTFK